MTTNSEASEGESPPVTVVLLYGVAAGDPITLFTAALILTGVVLLAAFVPCRRAFSADPSAALRQV